MATLDGNTLPDNYYLEDEHAWEPVAQYRQRAIDGTLHIQESERIGGRPITITGPWVTRAEFEDWRERARTQQEDMTLELDDGTSKTVRWRRGRREPAVSGAPLYPQQNPGDDQLHEITLRLIEVD